ncbi:Gfo/Idh/MocA family oxidoreductase [Bradyrhizobium lupini]|uniref:Gfo/Idh/MocA family oxidoreductase n=1 Tax=Rhizobium lupini TaxID=136996 RepID=UPI0034C662D8
MSWRREKGAGPIFLNLIHDVDLLRYLCGDIVAVQAAQSNRLRGNAVEETAVIILRFASGALGNGQRLRYHPVALELGIYTGENPAYSHALETCYQIGGTRASLAIPQLDLWHHPSKASWWAPIERERLRFEKEDPLGLQIANFCGVIRGTATPVVSGREGLKTLRVIDAIKRAAETGDLVSF